MNPKGVENDLSGLIEPVLKQEEVELVDLAFRSENGRWVLRILIDKPEGINLGDCAHISRKIEDLIEVEETIQHSYSLEVSSPGLDRPLKSEADFQRFSGKLANLRVKNPQEGRRNFKGRIVRCVDGSVAITDSQGNEFLFPLDEIDKARLEIETTFGRSTKEASSGRKRKRSRLRGAR